MNEFAVGQRYLSDSESDLGLGLLVGVDTRSVTVLFMQSEETRIYAKTSLALSRVIFAPGDRITDSDGNCFEVASCENIDGVIRYYTTCNKSLMETKLAATVNLVKPLERLLAGKIAHESAYHLRRDVLDFQSMLAKNPLRGLMGARVDIIRHQLYIAYEVGKRLAPRVLLADEVGLGKTVEAGLILHHQLTTGKAARVLVLVPESLQYQWLSELKRRFNLPFANFDLARTASMSDQPDGNVFMSEQLILASIDLLLDHRDLYEQAQAAPFDLLVVDEAHHLHWDSERGGNDKYRLIETLSENIKGLLLLTATPEQLGAESHFARLRLLDKNRFDDLDAFIGEQDDFSLVAQIATVLLEKTPLSIRQQQILADLLGRQLADLQALERDDRLRQQIIHELLDRHGTGRVLFRNTRDSVAGFLGRKNNAYPLPLPKAWVNSWHTQGQLAEQLWGEEKQPDGAWMQDDPRLPWLIELLKNPLKFDKVLLIARSGATVQNLELALRLHAGIKTAMFTEQMTLLECDQAAAYFADKVGAQILLCSEIGSEGRNFQFSHHLVLFDLPANPDTLEQRIGRLDRIGQTQVISIHTPFVMGTAQERLYHWYDGALAIFDAVSPAAQTVQEAFIHALKPLLQAADSPENRQQLIDLIGEARAYRLELEAELQAGRDRLLEYNSCRPHIAERIAESLHACDKHPSLSNFLAAFLEELALDYSIQRDGSWVIHPFDDGQMQDERLAGLPLDAAGMTLSFDRQFALMRQDVAFMTHEHPLMQAIYDLVLGTSFGNTSVATLRSQAFPAGFILLEVHFRIESIAPKALNLSAFLPSNSLRLVIGKNDEDLSAVATPAKLTPLLGSLDKYQALHVVKVCDPVIRRCYCVAIEQAQVQLAGIAAQAGENFATYYDKEIQRLQALQQINPNVRSDEIDSLKSQRQQGLQALAKLALVPDSVRVMVAVKEH